LDGVSSAATTSTTLTLSRRGAIVPRELLVAAIVAKTATGTISSPPGWTLVRRDISGNADTALTQALYYRLAGRNEPTSYLWRVESAARVQGAMISYRGVDARRPIDSHSGHLTLDAASFAAPSVHASTARERLVAFFGSSGANGLTPPKNMTEIFDAGASDIGLEVAASVAGTTGPTGARSAVDSLGVANAANFGELVTLRSACSATKGRPRAGQAPAILGSPYVGKKVRIYRGAWCGTVPLRLAYHWLRCGSRGCTAIRGATRATYVPTARDLDTILSVRVTATNANGTTTLKSKGKRVGLSRPTNTSLPTIAGSAAAGFELSTSSGSWTGDTPMTFGYEWRRCDPLGSSCAPIPGATGQTYVLTATDAGATLRAVVTATNTSGSATATSVATAIVTDAAAVAPMNTTPPAITGTAMQGATLVGSPGDWTGTAPIVYAYQWQRCDSAGEACVALAGANSETYTIGDADVGMTLRNVVTATNSAGSSSAVSGPTSVVVAALMPPLNTVPPSITGKAAVGSQLSASTGTWTGTPPIAYAYQWRRCDAAGTACASIPGAIGQNYQVTAGDAGSTLCVVVAASNSVGSNVAISEPTAVVPQAPATSIYWGAWMNGDPTYSYYYGGTWANAPWDAKTWSTFESNAGKKVSIVHWGVTTPWTHDFKYFQSTFNLVRNAGDLNLVDMDTASIPLRDIAAGAYDTYLTSWAQQASAWGSPFFLALDVEMNGTWASYSPGVNGNTPSDFVAMWRHFHDIADKAGATNITWVWCPNVDPGNRFTPYDQLYPGDAYVDWTCLDGFNKDGSQAFSWLFGSSYAKLLQLAPSKPVMISQTGSVEGGSGKAAWIKDALLTQLPTYFPRVKALVWFNWRIYEVGKWWEWPIESSSSSQSAFRSAIASPYYAPGGTFGALPPGSKIQAP
jgi:Glycosyl hydrolase family 26